MSTHSPLIARAGMDLEIRVFRFLLLVKPNCDHPLSVVLAVEGKCGLTDLLPPGYWGLC